MSAQRLVSNSAPQFEKGQLVTRFSIMLLAVALLGMGIGSTVPHGYGVLFIGGGCVGVIAYVVFECAARREHLMKMEECRQQAEGRLTRHVENSCEGDETGMSVAGPRCEPSEGSLDAAMP